MRKSFDVTLYIFNHEKPKMLVQKRREPFVTCGPSSAWKALFFDRKLVVLLFGLIIIVRQLCSCWYQKLMYMHRYRVSKQGPDDPNFNTSFELSLLRFLHLLSKNHFLYICIQEEQKCFWLTNSWNY